MKITEQLLKEHKACPEGYKWFVATFGENAKVKHTEIVEKLVEKKNCNDWIHWLYRNLHLSGECKVFYNNGTLCKHCYYDNGKLHGECKSFYYNGQICEHNHYKNGKLHGEYKWFYDNGQILKHCHFKHGKEVSQ